MLKLSTFETEIDKYQVFMPSYKQRREKYTELKRIIIWLYTLYWDLSKSNTHQNSS